VSNNSRIAANLDQNRPSVAQRLYTLFSSYDNYTTFSNNAWGPQADSIESLHDTIHSLTGGVGPGEPNPGHMAFIQWSAFDPVFFLHHCMVDRILAMWQALHPNTWVSPSRALVRSYTTRQGQVQSASTALTPFFSHENGTFWTSDAVRDHTVFGYTYPELVRGPSRSGDNVKALSRLSKQAVNRLYGSFSPASLFIREMRAQGFKGSRPTTRASRGIDSANRLPRSAAMEGKIFSGDRYNEWIANVRVGKQALGGSFSVHFFFGNPPRDPQAWPTAANHVGTMGVFAAATATPGDGQQEDEGKNGTRAAGQMMTMDDHDVSVSGTVPLTAALMKNVAAGRLASLEQGDVEPYLRENLKMSVLGPKGEVIVGECLLGMGIQIVKSEVRAPYNEEELPDWREARACFEVC
jgi:tyrosinase